MTPVGHHRPHFQGKIHTGLGSNFKSAHRSQNAEWLNQECAIVLDCRQFSQETFTKNHVVIGGLDCQENQGPGILYLNVLVSDTVTEIDDGELSYRSYC